MNRQFAGFQSISEFSVANDACGPTAETVALHQAQYPLTPSQISIIRNRDIQKGWFHPGEGEPLSSIYNDLTQLAHFQIQQYIPYNPSVDVSTIHTALETYSGIQPCIVQFINAQALVGNEKGVQSHFCCVGGIDSTQGYLTANGDDIEALAGKTYYPARWQSWDTFLAAKICGLLIPRTATIMSVPAGWKDDGTTLTAPNGHTVVHGFRQYILNYPTGWHADNVPMAQEIPYNSNSGQFFEYTILYWNGTATVELPPGSEAWRWYSLYQSETISDAEKTAIHAAISKTAADLQIAVNDNNAALALVS